MRSNHRGASLLGAVVGIAAVLGGLFLIVTGAASIFLGAILPSTLTIVVGIGFLIVGALVVLGGVWIAWRL